ncbi:Uma2 family endonuclease [Lyngbya confervoides]|uniref:Uma2 family endonuclease n=1 Tax=Lyngbya confervoides BDU141951 TaxID=1574623 RepID=A0ABD4T9G8_9CYAN|nr:Uma2 family endonuclease [Lyngbya confervoides]MCM1985123.1 Uma2 family endonuclease [Lyngbya confervoides BDU141951]
MTTAKQFYEQPSNLSVEPPQKDWPTMYDLPSEDPQEPGLPDEFHYLQPQLLSTTLKLPDVPKEEIFTGADMNLYYDLEHSRWYKRPDWFAVLGVPRLYDQRDLRLSYVVWDEQAGPSIVVELISPGTAMADLGEIRREQNGTPTKWEVYEQILQVPHYIVYDRYQDKLWIFLLKDGVYQEQSITDDRFWFNDLGIGIGLWNGEYEGITRPWLRWYDAGGEWVLTETEQERSRAEQELRQRQAAERQAEQERSRAEQELRQRQAAEQQAEQERSRADRLAERLRELGIDPDEV